MQESNSVTEWLQSLKQGDGHAESKIWNAYFERLVRMARQKLGPVKRHYDEEDAALSAFNSFFEGVKAGRFPDLNDRDNLWKLLVVITVRCGNAHV